MCMYVRVCVCMRGREKEREREVSGEKKNIRQGELAKRR